MFQIKDKVEQYLTKYPHLRDDDNKLMASIWEAEYNAKRNKSTKDIPAWDFLFEFSKGSLTSSESVRRCRQKLQEENPHLRGKKWALRHQQGDNMRQNVGTQGRLSIN